MKLIHIIASCFLTFACANMWTGMISSCHKTIVETQRIERSLERDSFLYEGFNKICSSKTGIEWQSEMFEWKKLSSALWHFDSIFFTERLDCYEASWKTEDKIVRVFFPKK